MARVIKIWWGLWLVGGLLAWLSFRSAIRDDATIDDLRSLAYLDIVVSVLRIAGAAAAFLVVWRLSSRQQAYPHDSSIAQRPLR